MPPLGHRAETRARYVALRVSEGGAVRLQNPLLPSSKAGGSIVGQNGDDKKAAPSAAVAVDQAASLDDGGATSLTVQHSRKHGLLLNQYTVTLSVRFGQSNGRADGVKDTTLLASARKGQAARIGHCLHYA